MKTIDIGKEFYFRLANRNESQGDGKHSAVEFREKYLSHLDNQEVWKQNDVLLELEESYKPSRK